MSSLVKSHNINMSDAPVVIEVDEFKVNEDVDVNVDNETLDECPSDEVIQDQDISKDINIDIKEIEDKAIDNAKLIEENAKRIAEGIIFDAKTEAEKIKIQNQIEINQQIQVIKKNASIKAKEDAKEAVFRHLSEMSMRVETAIKELEKNQRMFFVSLEKNIPQFALEIAGKILFKKVTQTPEEMDMLIKNAIAGIKGATWIDVKVGEGLKEVAKEIVDEMSENLKDRGTILDVQAVKENNWEIIAESDKGIIDSSINTQMQNLMEFIETYQKKQGE